MSDREEVSSRSKQDGTNNILEYRLGQLESDFKEIDHKVDRFDSRYISRATLDLMLEPWKQTIRDIVAERKNEIHLKGQLKIAIGVAFVSPILSGIIGYLIYRG